MVSKGEIIVLFNEMSKEATRDEIDALYQVNAVSAALEQLGYTVSKHPFPGNLKNSLESLKELKPLFIFNLVESVAGNGKLSYLAPSLLEALNIKYTGNSAEVIILTTNKVVTKKLLKFCGIATPQWITDTGECDFTKNERYIIKPVYEDGSVDLYQNSIVTIESTHQIREMLSALKEKTGKEFFAEKYIEGRELNVSILGNSKMPWVLPPTEIKFTGYKENHIDEILSYRSKWEEDSFEYKGVSSLNIFDDSDNPLLEILKENAVRCWHEFGLNGYARIDFRIDHEGKAWVLEINANPCITPEESSFLRAAAQEGLSYTDVVKQIISAV